MLILTEKPSVAKDFAAALSCKFYNGAYRNEQTIITNCIGHLFKEEKPGHYGTMFPIIPEHWDYCLPEDSKLAQHSKFVLSLLKEHKKDKIIIATDADREGEIIARECLEQAGIKDISNIKRFWVSQALTAEVIKDGLNNAKPLSEYNLLAKQGFARQHADWLVGMNFCRYITQAANTKLTVGRVQTAILSAIEKRCEEIRNFESKKYYEHYGIFQSMIPCDTEHIMNYYPKVRGIYFEPENIKGFDDDSRKEKLKTRIGKTSKLIDSKIEKKVSNPPQLYNLNAVQKDAFKYFGYSADKTLKIIQSLYEELKCVSYPRTPSRVMGSGNVELCKNVADRLCKYYSDYAFDEFRNSMNISLANKRCFNDEKLEAHHALIPLKELPENATDEQNSIYTLILDRFFIAFLPEEQYEKQTYILDVDGNRFRITGKKILDEGWKTEAVITLLKHLKSDRHVSVQEDDEESEEEQLLENINWNELKLSDIETKEKWTKPPVYYNEASILSFMENPKADRQLSVEDIPKKLVGLGTAATRHTFIPLLMNRGYIELQKKNLICTELGSALLKAVRSSPIKALADISLTTDWEEQLNENPDNYMSDIKTYIRKAVSQDFKVEVLVFTSSIKCPACGKEIRKGKTNWFCTGYKEGCKFTVWENVAGAKLLEKDVIALCEGKKTGIKHCTSKTGKSFDCKFELDEEKKIKFVFE